MLKICPVCKLEKPITKQGLACKSCGAERTRQWRLNNPEKAKISNRKSDLKKRYNITPEEFDAQYNKQLGHCAGCDIHASQLRRRLCVDHDHSTGKLRGLLCDDCNIVLGHAKDDPTTLRQLANYIECSISELADQNSSVVEVKFPKKVG